MSELEALQTTLEAEHAAVYLYALLGSRTSQSAEPDLYAAVRGAYEAHLERRDTLIGEIADLGEVPDAAAPVYASPVGLDTADGRFRAALELERGCAETYAALVAASGGRWRSRAIALLDDAATRALSFRGTPEIFPGAEEYAGR